MCHLLNKLIIVHRPLHAINVTNLFVRRIHALYALIHRQYSQFVVYEDEDMDFASGSRGGSKTTLSRVCNTRRFKDDFLVLITRILLLTISNDLNYLCKQI
jgi:hypothetical protein